MLSGDIQGRVFKSGPSLDRHLWCVPVARYRGQVGYDWVTEVEAVSVTYVRALGLQHVGDVLHFDWDAERRITFAEAEKQQDYHNGRHAVQAEVVGSQRGSWLILVEPNGYLAQVPDALSALSDADVALSVYWNINAQMRFALYADGVLVRSFDPLLTEAEPQGKPLTEEEGLCFGVDGEPQAATMTLAERLTAVAVARDWLLDTPRRTWTASGFSAV